MTTSHQTTHIHFLGIAGTFMTGLALLARSLGYKISGTDARIYPPMSDILAGAGVRVIENYAADNLPSADLYVIGNAMQRGVPSVEKILNEHLPYVSAPEWLARHLLRQPGMRTVCAVAGTHGKTTTTALLAHLCRECGLRPGYLIGGHSKNFNLPADPGGGDLFVLEADEYDSAFFDKRAKFIHYRPDILVINNLEYDHADIFPDMEALVREFRHLLRTVPERGHVIYRHGNKVLEKLLAEECRAHRHRLCHADELPEALAAAQAAKDATLWTIGRKGSGNGHDKDNGCDNAWFAEQYILGGEKENASAAAPVKQDAVTAARTQEETGDDRSGFKLQFTSRLTGRHNADNTLAALACLRLLTKADPTDALAGFRGVERRLQSLGFFGRNEPGIELISDFAHHPTAIRASLEALKEANQRRLLAVVVPASNSMRLGVHKESLAAATAVADEVFWFAPRPLHWDPTLLFANERGSLRANFFTDIRTLCTQLGKRAKNGDRIVIMSNAALTELTDGIRRELGPAKESSESSPPGK